MSNSANDIELRFHHGGISVPDLDASIAWYQRMLGFDVERRFHIPQIPADVAILQRGSLRLELFQVPNAHALPEDRRHPDRDNRTHGNKHVAFAVRDVKQAECTLRARGADIALVVDAAHGAGFFVRDNAGNLIEFVREDGLWLPDSAVE
jgi:methylmalonyl-CoA/ethylmalonyl-CoA epimerase